MNKKIELLYIANQAELFTALKIRKKLDKVFVRQSANCLILSLLVLAFLLKYYYDYLEYYFFDYDILGFLAFCSVAVIPSFLFVYLFVKKHRPLEVEIERHINANPAILGDSKSLLSEEEFSYLSSLRREDGANLQRVEKRVRCRE